VNAETETLIEKRFPGMKDDINDFEKTGIPRCYFCKKEYTKYTKHSWKPSCEHNKSVRLHIG